ncbi:MAG: hydrogen peroxide-inducible genes activator [Methylophilales bacterium]|nr:hydrogen peroxide-inducible genes activator [Methylophilales bacterium]
MTLNELRYIVAVSRERNFRRAAERCFVTQPALSLAIQKLEEELGVKLFERKKNDISLTTVGEAIVEQAARVLDEADRIKQLARQGTNPLVGALRLGAIYTVGPYLLPELIPILHKQASEMPLDMEENTTANLEYQLRNGLLDVAIIALPFVVPGVETLALYDEGFVVAIPVDHPWSSKTCISAEELSQEKVLLLNSGHCFSNQVLEACPSLSRNGEVLQGNSLETVRNMVASGLGITVLPMSATSARYNSPLIKLIPFAAPMPTRRIALAWRKSFSRVGAIEAIASSVKQITSPGFMLIA